MKTIVVDAYDSFVYIIHQYLRSLGAQPLVLRSDEAGPDRIAAEAPDLLVLGPGPGHPVESGHVELVTTFAGRIPMFGVCLGHQAIGTAFGGTVRPAKHLMHGKTSRIMHDGRGCFAAQPQLFAATRYHSLIVEEDTVPDCLEISARAEDDGYVMGLRHRDLPIESVQFHPESICTASGLNVFRSFIDRHLPGERRPERA
ncbi:anthranilate synthase component II [Micromonospora vinacea]|uniref:Anthranilate synthase component 2 n=1 Tax=Micromonospora vinacea TaxID=709878 RepID=A0ABS0KCH7_9ACTN|nr:aminodeoxychorismate/anthranilate synthase component II [Micromonospora vinacea]MBG6106216.1 anthranilate synthase component 2 [Micromonospora vinacea]WSZ77566.1 aminodeoxychorismate/anthranilate synthase component II [Micromonospora sp. NBC_00860]